MRINRTRLNLVLAEKCMSVQDLQKKSGVAIASLYKVKNNSDYNPHTRTIGRIAAALGVDVAEITEEAV